MNYSPKSAIFHNFYLFSIEFTGFRRIVFDDQVKNIMEEEVGGISPIWLALQKMVAANRSMRELPHTHSCFVCGESNPLGLKLRFETDGRIVQARFTLRPEHVGFRGTIHGGITATILDEIMVWACAVQTRRFAVCAELNVRYLSPIRPGDPVVVTGELAVNRRNKLFEAKASLRSQANAETVLASATGKYLPIKEADSVELARDFVGEPLMNFGGAV